MENSINNNSVDFTLPSSPNFSPEEIIEQPIRLGKLIVVLEDDKDIREMVSYILGSAGYRIAQCGTVKEFHEVMTQKAPDLCVMDISLPDGSGLDACRQLKENPQTSYIPVLLMSANANPEQLTASGYHDDFIAKPFNIIDFKKKVERYA